MSSDQEIVAMVFIVVFCRIYYVPWPRNHRHNRRQIVFIVIFVMSPWPGNCCQKLLPDTFIVILFADRSGTNGAIPQLPKG